MKQIQDLIEEKRKGRPIWDYHIYGPCSFEDNAVVNIVVEYGKERAEVTEKYTLNLNW